MTNRPYVPHNIDADVIVPGLYQGSAPRFGTIVKDAQFDVLVLTAKENSDSYWYPGVQVIVAPGDDDRRIARLLTVLPTWRAAAMEVAQHVEAGRNVLVTCIQGLNRSGFVSALALHFLTGWSGEQCVTYVKACRQGALFNETFVEWLNTNVNAVDRG